MSNFAVYFSPTGGTEKITKILADKTEDYSEIDLCRRNLKEKYLFSQEDICVIGIPSYGGRVPAIALKRMEGFQGNGAKAILAVVYGNRAYDDTLAELQDFLTEKQFCIVGAIATVAEHSIMHQFAQGRPDEADQEELIGYMGRILKKLQENKDFTVLQLPGNRPYREYNGVPIKPKVTKKCIKCGVCAKECPVGAIPLTAPDTTNYKLCISCMRCVKVCKEGARKLNAMLIKVAASKMKKTCSDRKDNELFL